MKGSKGSCKVIVGDVTHKARVLFNYETSTEYRVVQSTYRVIQSTESTEYRVPSILVTYWSTLLSSSLLI